MKPIAERGYDPEIPAAAAQRPQQIGVLGFARRYQPAVSHDDFGGEQIVASRPVKAHQPAITAAQGQSGNADLRISPTGNRQARSLGRAIELAPQHAGLGSDGASAHIHFDRLHQRQIDDKSTVADRGASAAVSAAAYCRQ